MACSSDGDASEQSGLRGGGMGVERIVLRA